MKSMREVDLDTYSLSLLTAKEDILNPRSSTNWALFTYDGIMNMLKLADSGAGGLKELTAKLHPKWPLYGMCRVGKAQPRIAMILWVGNEVDGYRRAECASHLPAIRAFFKEVHIFLPAHTLDEITEERICTLAYNAAVQGPRGRPSRRTEDRQAIVGTNYKRTIAAAEIQRIQRDSFWAHAEREEEERKKEEQRRAAEDRKQREKERLLQERRDATERERRMNEKEQKIKEQRRIQAQMEAEAWKLEKIKWEHEERECEEEEIRARYSRSQSEEIAVEAAALVSQRAVNPREFFRQLSSSSVHIASHPSSTCPARSPYRRLHQSQTDNIFRFNESPSSTPTSPYRSSVVSPYFPSTPTSRSPILFTSTTASLLPNGAMVSTKSQIQQSKMMEPQLQTQPLHTTDATESEIKTPVSDILDSLVFYPPPPTPEQLQPDESVVADEFPPLPPGYENSPEPSVGQPETLDDPLDPFLPPSCVLVPEPPTRPLPALSVAPRTLNDLEPGRDFTAWASGISTVEEGEDEGNEAKEMKYEGKDATEEMYGERGGHEEEKGGGEERAETGEMKNRGQEEHDGMTMENHESEKESNGKMMEKYESGKEQDGKMLDECESEEKQDGNIMEECEREEDKVGEIVEEFESGKIIEEKESEKYGKDLEKNMEEHEQDGKIVDAFDSEKEEKSMEISETEMKLYAKIMEKCGQETEQNRKMKEKCDEEHDSENEQAGKIMKEHEVEKIQDGGIMEELECEKEQDWKINEEFKSEQIQYAKIMEECGQDGKTVEKCEEEHKREKETDRKIMEEDGKKGNLDGKTVDAFDSEKEQDETSMEGFETEEIHKCEEEHEIEKEQNQKMIEDCEGEKIQYGDIEEHEREKEDGWKVVEGFETEKIQYVKIMEECGQENEQDGKIVEICEKHESEKEQERKIVENHENEKSLTEHESENEQDWKMIEDCGIEKIHDGEFIEEYEGGKENRKVVEVFETEKIMEVCGQENEQDGNIFEKCKEEHESEKEDDVEEQDGRRLEEQDWKIKEVFESEKEQDCKIGEIHEDGKSLEEHEGEKEQNQKMTENCESEKIQYGNIMDEHECENKQDGMTENQQDRQNQDNERMSHVDVDRAVNVTVLRKEESYTEIIKKNEATEVGDENEKEQMDTPLIQTEEADAIFSQHAPLFQESHATEPSQINDACIPEIISTTQDKNEPQISSTDTLPQINLPTIQVETDLSSLSNQGDSDMKEKTESVDSQASSETSKNSPDATSAEQTPDTETCATVEDEQTEMLQQDKIVESSNDLAEGINTECKTSPIAENQARTGQSGEGEFKQFPSSLGLMCQDLSVSDALLPHCQSRHSVSPPKRLRLQDATLPHVSLAISPWDPGSQLRASPLPVLQDATLPRLDSLPPLCCQEQDWKIKEVFESEKEQDCKIGEIHEDGKSLEEHEGEKEQNQKMTENCESEKIQYGNIMDEHECENKQDGMTENQQDRQNQDNERMSHVDVDRAVNVTVLRKEESYTEIIKKNEATEVGDENEKEQMDTPLIQTEEADAIFSQHAPLFQESHATEPSQINDACIPEIISTTQDKNEPQISSTDTLPQINLPTIQVETDLSSLSNQGDSDMKEKTESVDSQASSETSKNSPDATSAEQTPDTETCATVEDEQTEMLQQDKIVESSNDLAEGINTECKTSPIAENQARTGQSGEGEFSHFY
ncbi:axoneme-associated protein mst101(2)-like [Sinocyclocheilus grahami]|uniref:axoneme-associated protein mst101(2)-like n=1 Tax=Sinocyclocheilus grahami TaxID=75366 RepID=UPI0007AD08E1|nr:PREDICTED: axoneme-associated protein mst101(2)-like [Sinocyclocheilus grahami]